MFLHSGCPAEDLTPIFQAQCAFTPHFSPWRYLRTSVHGAQHPGLHGVERQCKHLVLTSQPGQSRSTLLIAHGGRSQLPMIFAFSTRLSQGKSGFPAPTALKQQVSAADFIACLPSTLLHSLASRAASCLKDSLGVEIALLLGRTSSLGGLMSPVGELIQPGRL